MNLNATYRYAAVLPAILAVLLVAASSPAQVISTTVQTYANGITATFPWRAGSLAAASFDGDFVDAALPGVYISGIAFLFPSQPQRWVSTGPGPVALAAADLDGDGDTDLAVAEQDGGTVSILTNDGLGNLTRTASLATGNPTGPLYPTAIAAIDVNQDGKLDLVVVNRGAETVVVLSNLAGSFVLTQTIPVGGEPNALVVGDFDKDTWQDVAVACAADDTVKILRNNHGLLSLAGAFEAGPCPEAVAAADMDGDGNLDLVAADHEAPQATVLRNDGTGQFTATAVPLTPDPTVRFEPPVDVQLVDMNHDNRIDIRCAGMTLLNRGALAFAVYDPNTLAGAVYAQALRPHGSTFYLAVASAAPTGSNTVSAAPRLYVRTPGDINSDLRVDARDLLCLAISWGLSTGEINFDAMCDLNSDGTVNVVDLLMLADFWSM